jgi:photosystem II stability/assembly factor-like uncharacterized protein
MSDDLERRVRDALRAAPLPEAPDTLRAHLARLPLEAGAPPTLRRRPLLRTLTLLAALVLVVLIGLMGLSAMFGSAAPVATVVPPVSPATSTAVPTGGPSPSLSTTALGSRVSQAGTFIGPDKGSVGFWVVSDSTLLVSEDGGATWSAGTVPSSGTVSGPPNALLDVLDASHVWALTADELGTGVSGDIAGDKLALTIHRSTDGGRSWADIPISGNYPGSLQALHFLDGDHGYLLVTPGRFGVQTSTLLRTTDGGLTWQVAGTDGWLGTELATPDASTIWAASAGDAGPVERRIFAVSGDGGQTWRDVALPDIASAIGQAAYLLQPPVFIPLPRGLFIGKPRGIVLVAHNDGSGIADVDRSDDQGETWTRVSRTTASSLAVVSYASWLRPGPNPGTIDATSDSGRTWQPLGVAGLPAAPITWIGFADAGHGALLAATADASSSGLYVTSDGGSTWRPADLMASSVRPPAGGLSQAAAFAAARRAYPDARGVVSGRVGQIRDFETGQRVVPPDRWVWAVVISGTFPFSCGPAPDPGQTHAPCPPPALTKTVLLDYATGKFIEGISTSGQ